VGSSERGIDLDRRNVLSSAVNQSVYLDCAAAMPVRREVAEAHAELCRTYVANPHATSREGALGRRAILRAERELLALLDVPQDQADVVWTSGGTEANNLALMGSAATSAAPVMAVSATAHRSLLAPCEECARRGGRALRLPVLVDGTLDLDRCTEIVSADTRAVAVCHVNNETGALHDLDTINRWLRRSALAATFIVDACQSVGKVPIPWRTAGVDLLTFGGRKIGGPASVGALIVRRGVDLQPIMFGGGQQRGLRPGTMDTVGVLELVMALRLARGERDAEVARIGHLNSHIRQRLLSDPELRCVVLSPESASPYILTVSFPGYEGAVLMRLLAERGVTVATGSACSAESREISHVLAAMGCDEHVARGALRISFGWHSVADHVDVFVDELIRVLGDY